jgi:hypothetical protein
LELQMEYLWKLEAIPHPDACSGAKVQVLGVLREYWTRVLQRTLTNARLNRHVRNTVPILDANKTTIRGFIRSGFIPGAPYSPHYAISVRALELFRTTRLRCPHLAIDLS